MVGGPVGAVAGAALGSKVDVLGGGKKKTKAVKPTPKPTPNVDAEKVKAARRAKIAKMLEKEKLNKEEVEPVDEACWKGYEKKGMKKMFGKMYPNCVKKKTKSEEVEFQEKLDLKKADMGDVVKDFYKSDAPQFKGRSKEKRREMAIAAKLTAERGKLPEDYSANPAQQAAIAIAKKERKQDLKVAQKKKIKEDSRLTSSNDMQSKMYADKNKSGKKMSDDEIKKEKGGKEFLDRIKVAKEKMNKEEVLDEIAMKKDKKVPLGRKSNPYGKRAVAKMIIKSLSEPARAKAGITKEQTELERQMNAIKTGMMNGKKLNAKQIEGMKAGLTQCGNKVDEGTSYGMYKGDGKPKGPMAKFGKKKKKEKKIEEKVNLKDKSSQYARSTKEVDTAMTDHVNRKRGTHYGKDGKVTEVGRYRRQSKRGYYCNFGRMAKRA